MDIITKNDNSGVLLRSYPIENWPWESYLKQLDCPQSRYFTSPLPDQMFHNFTKLYC